MQYDCAHIRPMTCLPILSGTAPADSGRPGVPVAYCTCTRGPSADQWRIKRGSPGRMNWLVRALPRGEGPAHPPPPTRHLPDHLDGLTALVKQAQEEDGGVHLTRDCLVEKTAQLHQVVGSKQAAICR